MEASEMPRCKTCLWWNCGQENEMACSQNPNFRICDNLERLGESQSVDTTRNDVLQYSYDESGCIYTGPEFGCVHYEQKG